MIGFFDAAEAGESEPAGVFSSDQSNRSPLSGWSCHGRKTMPDDVYRIIEVAGSSEKSIEDAIQNAVGRASRTLRQVGWFEVIDTRGHAEDGRVAHYQVTLKIGFTLEDDD
jgi:dodecin